MTLWNKLFGKRKKERQSSPAQKPRPAPHQTGSPPKQVSPAATLAQTNPQQQMASMMWVVKKPRYAHMAKAHELRGEFSQANYNYAMLAEAQTQTLGESHPDLATVLYEMARLNQHHHAEIEQMPQMQMILNTLGPGSQINMYYQSALQMRLMALGDQHTAYAQSLYGLASFYKEAQKATEALPLLEQALTIQSTEADPLPTALTTLCLADVNRVNGDPTAAIDLYQNGLSLLDLSSESLRAIDEAESYCQKAKDAASAGLPQEVRQDKKEAAWVQATTIGNDAAGSALLDQAKDVQQRLFDPYFALTVTLVQGTPSLLAMVLELHRQQYIRDFRTARLGGLERLAEVHRQTGNAAAAIPLLEEAAAMQSAQL